MPPLHMSGVCRSNVDTSSKYCMVPSSGHMTISALMCVVGGKIHRRSEFITTHTHITRHQRSKLCSGHFKLQMCVVFSCFRSPRGCSTTRGRPSTVLLLPTQLTHLGSAQTRWRQREPTQAVPNSCPFFPSGRKLPTHQPTNIRKIGTGSCGLIP